MFDIEQDQQITIFKLNHGRVNAMNIEFCREIRKHLNDFAASHSDAIILTSATNVFSAGVDLVRLINEDPDYVEEFIPALCDLLIMPMRMSIPVVAAVNGAAIAGGCVLACSCDYRLIADHATIGMPEMHLGVPLPSVPLEIVRCVTANKEFKRMIHLGSTYSGEQSVQVGLADQCCTQDQLIEQAIQAARQLSRIPSTTFALSKRQLRKPVDDLIAYGKSNYDSEVIDSWKSEAVRTMIRQYVANRLNK